MPDAKLGRVHRFRDHVVAGVNWRPTRFVDDVPNVRVCGLCRTIPKRTVVLPCSHVLCQSCHAANSQGSFVGLCPLDQEPFEETQCAFVELSAREANRFKVHCWNESQGCKFEGTMDELLRHYETECTFHTVECSRCGEGVLHKDLSVHYVARCGAAGSSVAAKQPSLKAAGVTLQDLGNALEDLKGLLKDLRHDELLSGLQSLITALVENGRSRQAMFAELTHALGTSEQNLKDDLAVIATAVGATLSYQSRSPRHPADEPSPSPLLLCSENGLILRKLEQFAHMSLNTLEYLRQNVTRHGQNPVTASSEPLVYSLDRFRRLTSALSLEHGLGEELARACYVLTLENGNEIFLCQEDDRKFAEATLWHTRDTYLTITVCKRRCWGSCDLVVEIVFDGLLAGSQCVLNDWCVNVRHPGTDYSLDGPSDGHCVCPRDLDSMKHFHREFNMDLDVLKNGGFLKNDSIIFEILLDYIDESLDSSTY
ncbi:hypothetical protein HPB49_020212 [Dermacentor silvarum]|uniref:Uncharacterized protein n=1 Tax=Dermacentor silvarum TaxID=543639 RepID=A0ACB8DR29_DERSI|nr:uncharacterized protein LOC125940693 [Dermacentor silvarum]KAH7974831.1 hypothetical protein HPB49_020212 [Dermacentor silvarum]